MIQRFIPDRARRNRPGRRWALIPVAVAAGLLLCAAPGAEAQTNGQAEPQPPPTSTPLSRLTVTPAEFERWMAGNIPDAGDVAITEPPAPRLVTPPPPAPVLVAPPPPPKLAPIRGATPPPKPAVAPDAPAPTPDAPILTPTAPPETPAPAAPPVTPAVVPDSPAPAAPITVQTPPPEAPAREATPPAITAQPDPAAPITVQTPPPAPPTVTPPAPTRDTTPPTVTARPDPPPPPPPAPPPPPSPVAPTPPDRQVAILPPDSPDTPAIAEPRAALPELGTIRIRFATEATELSAAARARLDEVAAGLRARPEIRVQIVGYASETVEATGQARRRSLYRVISVRKYLVEQGVLSTRMDVRALGDKTAEQPRDRVDVIVPPS